MSDLLTELLQSSQTDWLKVKCPALFSENGDVMYSDTKAVDMSKIGLGDGRKYYELVETGNDYIKNLLDAEDEYLSKKYGKSLYNHFKTERDKYIDDKIKTNCQTNYGNSGASASNINDSKSMLVQTFELYKEVQEMEDVELTKMNDGSNLNARKFTYRSGAVQEFDKYDTYLTYFYYLMVAALFIHLFTNKQLNIKNKWWKYLIILVIPLALKHVYRFIVRRVYDLKEWLRDEGPRNAFLNETFV